MGAAEDQKSGGSGRKGLISGGSGQRVLHEAVVVDVFSNPQALDNAAKAKLLTSGFAVANTARVQSMPRNSISAIVISDGGGQKNKPQIFYPLFPPNLSMPAKPGEQVWVIYPDGSNVDGYWLGRISCDYDVDDINYTHRDRESQRDMILAGSGKVEGSSTMSSTDAPNFVNGKENAKAQSRTLKQADDYETFYNNSVSLPEFTPEAVPRYTKQAPALCLQGSNNTLIALTEEVSDDGSYGYTNDATATGKGAIDIVAGRGQGSTAATAIANTRGNQEVDKRVVLAKTPTPNLVEGSPDFENDLSRVYITMNSSTGDTRFGSNGIVGIGGVTIAEPTGPYVVVKSTNPRIIARSDGSIKIVHNAGSSIVLDASGNIQISPAAGSKVIIGDPATDASIGNALSGHVGADQVVRGNDLVAILTDLTSAILSFARTVKTGGKTPGYGAPNPDLAAAGIALETALKGVAGAGEGTTAGGDWADCLSNTVLIGKG